MLWCLLALPLLVFPSRAAESTNMSTPTVVVAIGAAGGEEFGNVFREAAASWQKAAETAKAEFVPIGVAPDRATNDLQDFRSALTNAAGKSKSDELWIVLIGHGTFDGRETKFNMRGPDLSANELSNLLASVKRPVAVVNGTSSSAPFIKALSGQNRIVVTATRSGAEENFTRFGRYMAQTIADPEADLDKDGQTSLLEAFLMASRRVADFYKNEGRLATEHALIDDNGDGFGTPVEWFRGIRATKKAANNFALDGTRAHQWHLIRSNEDQKLTAEQRQKRDELEREIAHLREQKSAMAQDEYYSKLEALLVKLSEIVLSGESASFR